MKFAVISQNLWRTKIIISFLISSAFFINNSFTKSVQVPIGPTVEIPNEHNDFFKLLSPAEQYWLMKLAILYHESDLGISPIAQSYNLDRKDIETLPLPHYATIPQSLITNFLNGNVPQGWQRGFTVWLKKTYNLRDENLRLFKETESFCRKNESCPKLSDIGGLCCPFG